jgi:hypothetical protein
VLDGADGHPDLRACSARAAPRRRCRSIRRRTSPSCPTRRGPPAFPRASC